MLLPPDPLLADRRAPVPSALEIGPVLLAAAGAGCPHLGTVLPRIPGMGCVPCPALGAGVPLGCRLARLRAQHQLAAPGPFAHVHAGMRPALDQLQVADLRGGEILYLMMHMPAAGTRSVMLLPDIDVQRRRAAARREVLGPEVGITV